MTSNKFATYTIMIDSFNIPRPTLPKTNMASWINTIFNRRYIDTCSFTVDFSIVSRSFSELYKYKVGPYQLNTEVIPPLIGVTTPVAHSPVLGQPKDMIGFL